MEKRIAERKERSGKWRRKMENGEEKEQRTKQVEEEKEDDRGVGEYQKVENEKVKRRMKMTYEERGK